MIPMLIVAVVWITPFGNAVRDIIGSGILKEAKLEKFSGTTDGQLRLMYEAAQTHHQSEEVFPEGKTWMDDVLLRMKTQNLLPGEAEKKIVRQDLIGQPNQFGFAMNSAAAGRYKGDLKDPNLILFYTSKSSSKNLYADPTMEGLSGGRGITISGQLLSLP